MADNQVIQIAPPTIVQKGAVSARIVGMMALAVVVSVVAAETRVADGTTKKDAIGVALSSPFLIIAGGTGATMVFVLLADFGGAPGEKLGGGLAVVVLLSVLLVQAAPLWKGLSRLFQPTTGRSGASTTKGTPGLKSHPLSTPSTPTFATLNQRERTG